MYGNVLDGGGQGKLMPVVVAGEARHQGHLRQDTLWPVRSSRRHTRQINYQNRVEPLLRYATTAGKPEYPRQGVVFGLAVQTGKMKMYAIQPCNS